MPDHTAATIQLDDAYPEHAKLREVADKSQLIGEFVDEWLPQQGITLIAHDEGGAEVSVPNIRRLLAQFFDIDEDKIEAEKDAMLRSLR